MKRIILFLLIIFVAGLLYFFLTKTTETQDVLQESSKHEPLAVSYDSIDYHIYYTDITDHDIVLVPNFDAQLSGNTLIQNNNCTAGINGGFYTQEDKPLGLFKTNNILIEKEKEVTNLVTGFFSVDRSGYFHISSTYDNSYPTILQTGPLMYNINTLSIKNDKPARRQAIVQTTNNDFYIVAVTIQGQATSGPLLSDLPTILFSVTEPFTVKTAINLDGGSASYYRGDDGTELAELTYIGSLLCVK